MHRNYYRRYYVSAMFAGARAEGNSIFICRFAIFHEILDRSTNQNIEKAGVWSQSTHYIECIEKKTNRKFVLKITIFFNIQFSLNK